jgi:hypothetical protein
MHIKVLMKIRQVKYAYFAFVDLRSLETKRIIFLRCTFHFILLCEY